MRQLVFQSLHLPDPPNPTSALATGGQRLLSLRSNGVRATSCSLIRSPFRPNRLGRIGSRLHHYEKQHSGQLTSLHGAKWSPLILPITRYRLNWSQIHRIGVVKVSAAAESCRSTANAPAATSARHVESWLGRSASRRAMFRTPDFLSASVSVQMESSRRAPSVRIAAPQNRTGGLCSSGPPGTSAEFAATAVRCRRPSAWRSPPFPRLRLWFCR
jgi:hypothetical protein